MTTDARPHLLPPSSSPLERAAAQALAAALDYPIPLRKMWDSATCPLEALPFLAWARSVDRWDEAWPEATKRAVVAAAFEVHRKKGTIGALRRVIEPFGYLVAVHEWWQSVPPGAPGTFTLDVDLQNNGLTANDAPELERLIDETKPLTRHIGTLRVTDAVRGNAYGAAATLCGDSICIGPKTANELRGECRGLVKAATHLADVITVNPQGAAA